MHFIKFKQASIFLNSFNTVYDTAYIHSLHLFLLPLAGKETVSTNTTTSVPLSKKTQRCTVVPSVSTDRTFDGREKFDKTQTIFCGNCASTARYYILPKQNLFII